MQILKQRLDLSESLKNLLETNLQMVQELLQELHSILKETLSLN